MIPYEDYKVYGPYNRSDGRLHVVLVHLVNKIKRTISYPKYRMEIILGRYLNEDEEVHHKDENLYNNDDSNFEVVNGRLHKSFHRKGTSKYLPEFWSCAYCGKQWLATVTEITQRLHKQKQGKAIKGPFCSRQCQGKICN